MCASDRSMHTARRTGRLMGRLLPAVALGLAVLTAHAQSDREQEQVKRLRLQLRQLQQDQATAQEGQAKADQARQQSEKSLTEAQSELKRLRVSSGAAAARSSTLGKEAEALREERSKLQAEVQALNTQLAELRTLAQAAQTRALASETDLKGRNQALSDNLALCGRHNAELTRIGEDLLARYENKGITQVIGEREPFIQTSRVRLENFVAQYQDKIDAVRLKDAPASAINPP